MDQDSGLEASLLSIAVPLLAIDNAVLYVVEATSDQVHLHLGGAYGGCPGNSFVERCLLTPLVQKTHPRATLKVTSGLPVPSNAKRLDTTTAAAAE